MSLHIQAYAMANSDKPFFLLALFRRFELLKRIQLYAFMASQSSHPRQRRHDYTLCVQYNGRSQALALVRF